MDRISKPQQIITLNLCDSHLPGITAFPFLMTFSFFTIPAWALDTSWTAGTENFLTGSNWDNGVPTVNDNIFIDNSGTANLTGIGSGDNLYVGDNANGSLVISDGGALTTASTSEIGVFSGSNGSVTVTGSGSSLINGNSLTVGDAGNGTLIISNGGKVTNTSGYIGSSSGGVGTLTVTGSGSRWENNGLIVVGATGNSTGSGTLIISNGGVVENTTSANIGGNNLSTGKVTVTGSGSQWNNSGYLQVGGAGTGSLTISDGASVNVDGAVVVFGALNIGSAQADAATLAGTLNTDSVLVGNSSTVSDTKSRLVFNHTNTDYIFSPDITGTGYVDLLAGTTQFSGDLSGYTGTMKTDGGTLSLASNRTVVLGGNYNQTSNGSLKVGISDTTTYGKLVVNGTATLASDAKIEVDVTDPNLDLSNALINGFQNVISAGVLVTDGTFSVTDNSFLYNFDAVKDGNTVDLVLVQDGDSSVVDAVTKFGSTSAQSAASVIEGNTVLKSKFASLTTEQQVANAVDSVLPSVSGGMAQLTSNISRVASSAVATRQASLNGISSGDGFMTDGHAWFKPMFGKTEQKAQQSVTGYEVSTFGLALGIDGDMSNTWSVGLAFIYLDSEITSRLSAGNQTVSMDSYLAKIYSTKALNESTALNLQAGLGTSNHNSNRRLFNDDLAVADYDSTVMQLSAELERQYQITKKTNLMPFLNAAYNHVKVDNYGESGAGALNLIVDGSSTESFIIGTGVKANHEFSDALLLIANADIGVDLMAERSNLTSSFEGGGARFTTEGIKSDPVMVNMGLGIKYALENGVEITASYKLSARQNYTDKLIYSNIRIPF